MPEGSHRFQIGSLSCAVLTDGYFSYPASWFFPNADPAGLFHALAQKRLPTENILSPYTCLLIQTGGHVMLVDAGAGDSSATTGAIVARLEMEGVRPKDVDTVLLTHAHPDHIGGAVDPLGRPVFPNARYVLSEAELDFWSASRVNINALRVPDFVKSVMAATARRCLDALRHQLEPLASEREIIPGVRALPSPGHTPGHLSVLLASGNERLLHLGDAALHPLHLEHPDWENGFDLAPQSAASSLQSLLERAVDENMRLMAFHFPFPSVGRVERRDSGWTWSPCG